MAVNIESIGELEKLVRKLGIKVDSPEQLRTLWETVNTPPDPEVARMEAIKLVGLTIPIIVAGIGGLASLVLMAVAADTPTHARLPMVVGSLAVIWGAVAAVCVPTVLTALTMLYRLRPAPAKAPKSGQKPAEFPGPDRSMELPIDDPAPARGPTPLSERVTTWDDD